ncbi:MAG TPA: RluA family pseudouridine synthase [Candidatus Limnocylindria bacterium]|nr:RluA family pseudouridine synthase [Candidatus Limnocylindria bacterium]
MKRHEFTAAQGGPVLPVLRRELPLLPPHALRDALKRRDVRVNGRRVGKDAAVQPGDAVVVYTAQESPGIPVVHEDERCLVVNKPAGVNTDENDRSGFSLLSWARERAAGNYDPELVHRLDNRTSGLLVVAKDAQSASLLREAFRLREVEKVYACQVRGMPDPRAGVFTAWLTKDAAAARVTVSADRMPGSLRIVTEYETLESRDGASLLRVTLHTGRTHQIRAHLAFLGHPVIGDEVYGDWAENRRHGGGLRLCAAELAFPEGTKASWLAGMRFRIQPPF